MIDFIILLPKNRKRDKFSIHFKYSRLCIGHWNQHQNLKATKDELIDYAMRSGAPLEVIENLQEMEDEGEIYESIEDIWPDYPSKEDFFFNEEEY